MKWFNEHWYILSIIAGLLMGIFIVMIILNQDIII